jgi:hypothetical protein
MRFVFGHSESNFGQGSDKVWTSDKNSKNDKKNRYNKQSRNYKKGH